MCFLICFAVAICDIVYDVESIHDQSVLLTILKSFSEIMSDAR